MRKKGPSEIALLADMNAKLDDLIALIIVQGKEKEDQVKIMVDRGYSNSQIGSLLGLPKGTVDGIRAKRKRGRNK